MNALETPVYLAAHNRIAAVHQPGIVTDACAKRKCVGPHTCDWRAEPGSLLNMHRVRPELVRTTLDNALHAIHRTEVHIGCYAILQNGVPLDRQPRVTKNALLWLQSQGYRVVMTMYQADMDTPGHVLWTPAMLDEFMTIWNSRKGPLETCGMYLSPRGARIDQPLLEEEWPDVDEGERGLGVWLQSLADVGIYPSVTAIKAWGQLMRAPNIRKGSGEIVRSALIDVSRIQAISPIKAPAPSVSVRKPRRQNTPQLTEKTNGEASLSTTGTLPEPWRTLAGLVGAAIRDTVSSDWRRCYMAVSGAALERGCPPMLLPAFIAQAHLVDPQWAYQLADREQIARSTAVRWGSGLDAIGFATLAKEFPAVAEVFERRTMSPAEMRVRSQLNAASPAPVPAAEATALLRKTLSNLRGVVCIQAPPGTGKTQTVTDHAQTLPSIGERALPGSRLGISSPRHDLAKQTAAKLPKSLHLFSPPSHTDSSGKKTCIYSESAQSFASGGQSVVREFCDGRNKLPCERAAICPAKRGFEGDEKANLVAGVHGLINAITAYVGTSGSLIVDEPGDILQTERFELDDIETAERYLDAFVSRYASAIAPALRALLLWVREIGDATAPQLTPLDEVIRVGAVKVPSELLANAGIDPESTANEVGELVVLAALGAIDVDATSKAPPLAWRSVVLARTNAGRAAELGRASRVLNALWRGLSSKPVYAARIDDRSGERALTLTGPNENLLAAVRHTGPVAFLDAQAVLLLPGLEKILGYRPQLVDVSVADGAPIARTILVHGNATRTSWLPRGVPDWEAIIPAIKLALAWLAEDPSTKSAALFCWKEVSIAIACTLRPDDPASIALAKASKVGAQAIERARSILSPILGAWKGDLFTAHYLSLTGMNHFSGCDATITLGDPRPNLGTELDKALYLGLSAEGRLDALAAAELLQAHGRLRTIHRTKPGRQLHIGSVVPAGWPGLSVDVRRMPVGRPKTEAGMDSKTFARAREQSGMGLRAFARALGITHATVTRYESGERSVPADIARAVLNIVGSGSETPLEDIPYRGFGTTWSGQSVQ